MIGQGIVSMRMKHLPTMASSTSPDESESLSISSAWSVPLFRLMHIQQPQPPVEKTENTGHRDN